MREMKDDRKTRYTKMVIRNSLMELMKQKPISKITIKELCENADINRTTFYRYYSDQYDLLRKIVDDTLVWAKKIIAELLLKTEKNEMMEILEGIFQYIIENANHIQVLLSEQGDLNFQKQLFTIIYNQCGVMPMYVNTTDLYTKEAYFVFVISGSVGLIQHWLKNGLDKTAKEMAEIIYSMTLPVR